MRNVAFHDILYLWLYNRLVDRELSKNFLVDPSQRQVGHPWPTARAGFTYRLFKPRASRSKGTSSKLWYALSQLPVYDQFDKCSSKLYALIIREIFFFHLSRFRVDNARVFQGVSINLNMPVGQAACWLLCRYTQCTFATSRICWITPIATCESGERTCVRVWNAPDQSFKVALQIRATCTTHIHIV